MKLFLIKSNKVKYQVAQRVLSFKKKTRLTVTNTHSNLLNSCSVHLPLSAGGKGEPPTKFTKRGGDFRGNLLGKRGSTLFGGGGGGFQFLHKNKSKY